MTRGLKRLGTGMLALCLLLLGVATVLPAQAETPEDGIALSAESVALGDDLTISYSTDAPNPTNWIGVYRPGDVPGPGTPSLIWRYAPEASGELTWNSRANEGWTVEEPLTPGSFVVYLLAEDGYEVIGGPVEFSVVAAGDQAIELSSPTLTLGEELTIDYRTEEPSDTNWIGIYRRGEVPGGGPVASVWRYAPGTSGSFTWNSATDEGWSGPGGLAPGEYVVYLLADDGYEVIGAPVPLRIEEFVPHGEVDLDAATLTEGDTLSITYSTDVDGPLELGLYLRPEPVAGVVNVPDLRLPLTAASGTVTWVSAGDPAWRGEVAALRSGEYSIALFREGDYSRPLSGYEALDFTAQDAGAAPIEPVDLSVLTFNIWMSGTNIPDGPAQIADVIRETGADIVFLPEGYEAVGQVATLLGYNYFDGRGTDASRPVIDTGVISAYPIIDAASLDGRQWHKAVVDAGGHEVAAYGGHLEYRYYVTYLPRGYGGGTPPPWPTSEYGWDRMPAPITDVDLILELNEASGRPAQAKILVADAQREQERGRLVVAGGDFNEPSHLDWGEDTSDLMDHNGTVVPWQTTTTLAEGGLVDAYRAAHPDPVTHPGITWPSDNPLADVSELTWAPEADERDRIDYVFFMPDERLSLTDAIVVGPQETIVRSERVTDTSEDVIFTPEAMWPTDHKAVLAEFTIADPATEPTDPDPTDPTDPDPTDPDPTDPDPTDPDPTDPDPTDPDPTDPDPTDDADPTTGEDSTGPDADAEEQETPAAGADDSGSTGAGDDPTGLPDTGIAAGSGLLLPLAGLLLVAGAAVLATRRSRA